MKWLAIVNPRTGRHTADEMRQISAELHDRLGADIAWCAYKKHGLQIVRQNQGYDGYIAVGGDGSIADVVNGIDCGRHTLGIIPAGTGNGLARDLNLADHDAAFHALERENFQDIDVIKVRYRAAQTWHERTMISTSGVGYLAGATAIAELPLKRLGRWVYAMAAVVQSIRQQPFLARWRTDDAPWQEQTLTTFIVHNTQYVGQFRIFPEASLTDARLNILFGRLKPREQLLEDLGTLTQTYLFKRSVHLAPRRLEIVLPAACPIMVDGDVIPDVDRIRYEVAPSILRCCTGLDADHGVRLSQDNDATEQCRADHAVGARNPANTQNPPRIRA